MYAERLLGSLIGSALGVRPKRHGLARQFLTGGGSSFLNTSTLLSAAGLAWGAYEVFRSNQGVSSSMPTVFGGSPVSTSTAASLPPLPSQTANVESGGAADMSDGLRRLVRLTISAAKADGDLGEEEYRKILEDARAHGAEKLVLAELANPQALAAIVEGVGDSKLAADLYVLAYGIVRADEDVTNTERIWLAQLANLLRLDVATTARLETETAQRIDTAAG